MLTRLKISSNYGDLYSFKPILDVKRMSLRRYVIPLTLQQHSNNVILTSSIGLDYSKKLKTLR